MDPRLVSVLQAMGKRIAEYRRLNGMTQVQLGEAAGMERTAVQRIEYGRQNLTIGTILRLADALGVEPSALLVDLGHEENR